MENIYNIEYPLVLYFDSIENYLSLAWWSCQPIRNCWQVIEISNLVREKGKSSATRDISVLYSTHSQVIRIQYWQTWHNAHQSKLTLGLKKRKQGIFQLHRFKSKVSQQSFLTTTCSYCFQPTVGIVTIVWGPSLQTFSWYRTDIQFAHCNILIQYSILIYLFKL